jgi:hypothetical protein
MKKLLILLCLMGLFGCSSIKTPDYDLTARQFYEAFNDDYDAASLKYDNQTIRLTGFVQSIIKTENEVNIRIWPRILVIITNDIDQVPDVSSYQRIVIQGTSGYHVWEFLGTIHQDRAIINAVVEEVHADLEPEHSLTIEQLLTAVNNKSDGQYHYSIIAISGNYHPIENYAFRLYHGDNDSSNYLIGYWKEDSQDQRKDLQNGDTYTFICVILNLTGWTNGLYNCKLA